MDKVWKGTKIALQCIAFVGLLSFAAQYGVIGVIVACIVIGAIIYQ